MNIYNHKRKYKFGILALALLISILSLTYSQILVEKLSEQERQRIELYAEAQRRFAQSTDNNEDLTFVSEVITRNENIPVILTTENDSIISHKNLSAAKSQNPKYLQSCLQEMKKMHKPIIINLLDGQIERKVYYNDSTLLRLLFWFPYAQLGVFAVFVLIAYMAFNASRKAEQNQVWVGMSKETAHQLGTPISSLIAWVELMKAEKHCHEYADEMQQDLTRLETIVERFSKVGSQPKLKNTNLKDAIQNSVNYMRRRASSQIQIQYQCKTEQPILVPFDKALLSWVIENIIKNGVDAITGKGIINIEIFADNKAAFIDITDTGKGIPRKKFKRIFQPGITSKQRGWGLGLSLSKRIIDEYHNGSIFVKWSEQGKGTTIRIVLKQTLN